jgi:RNA polymerase-binding transcription factor DksA
MGPIDDTDLTRATVALRSEHDALLAALRSAEKELADVRELRADAVDDEHDPEGSTLSSDWSRIFGLRDATVERLAATERALERIEGGTYGTCLRCGRAIAAGRLVARPAAEYCIDCARVLGQ